MTYKTCLLTTLLPLVLFSCSDGDEANIDASALSGGVNATGNNSTDALFKKFYGVAPSQYYKSKTK